MARVKSHYHDEICSDPRTAELETALENVRRALLDGNWSLALGYAELALGLHRKAA